MNYYSPAYLLKLHDTTHPETTTPLPTGPPRMWTAPPSPPPKKKEKKGKKRIWSMKALAWSMEDPIVKMIDYLRMVKVSKMFIGNIDYIPLYFKNRLFLLFKSNESKLCIYKSFYFHLLNTGSASRVKAPVILEFNLFLSHFSIFLISSWKF